MHASNLYSGMPASRGAGAGRREASRSEESRTIRFQEKRERVREGRQALRFQGAREDSGSGQAPGL